jgi:tRNA 2-selenouridine synthase
VRLGLARVAPKLTALGDRILELAGGANGNLLIHCWRGGMRSGSVAWLAHTLGCRPATLAGGYKAFRRRVLGTLQTHRKVRVVAGLTGTGKTGILHALAALGEPVIDLEALARHKGSAFGDLGEPPQPTQEQFENELAGQWSAVAPGQAVWLEDESRMVGRRVLPAGVWQSKCDGHYELVEISDEERIRILCEGYARHPAAGLESRILLIRDRLGGARTAETLNALRAGDHAAACRELLHYYDRTYRKSLAAIPAGRLRIHRFAHHDAAHIAATLRNMES